MNTDQNKDTQEQNINYIVCPPTCNPYWPKTVEEGRKEAKERIELYKKEHKIAWFFSEVRMYVFFAFAFLIMLPFVFVGYILNWLGCDTYY